MNTTVDGALNQLLGMSPPAIGFIALLVLNLVMRRIPHVPNWVIPVVTIFCGTPMFAWLLTLVEATKVNPFGLNCIFGFVVSGLVACCYGAIVLFAESKWPWLANVINGPVQNESPAGEKPKEPTQP